MVKKLGGDCTCPTDSEMKMLAKAFGIHPLTAEDIRMQETREKLNYLKVIILFVSILLKLIKNLKII